MAPDTAFLAYFGHIIGYGAGYYGYAWADAIAADMATVFEKSPGGYFDKNAGKRLRKEIYEVGDSRDVNVSIEKFLGRPRSTEPFLKRIGIEKRGAKDSKANQGVNAPPQAELVRLAKQLFEEGQYDAATQPLQTVLQNDPQNPAALYYLSLVEAAIAQRAADQKARPDFWYPTIPPRPVQH
jgi:hypothetical protein